MSSIYDYSPSLGPMVRTVPIRWTSTPIGRRRSAPDDPMAHAREDAHDRIDLARTLFGHDEPYESQVDDIVAAIDAACEGGYPVVEGACGTGKTTLALTAGIDLVRDPTPTSRGWSCSGASSSSCASSRKPFWRSTTARPATSGRRPAHVRRRGGRLPLLPGERGQHRRPVRVAAGSNARTDRKRRPDHGRCARRGRAASRSD